MSPEEIRCPDCNKLLFKVLPEKEMHVDLETVCPRCKASFIWVRRSSLVGQVLLTPVHGTAAG